MAMGSPTRANGDHATSLTASIAIELRNAMNQRFSGPPQDPTASTGWSKSRMGRWMAVALALAMAGSVVSVRFQSRRTESAAAESAAPKSEVADSTSTDGNVSLATAESGLGTEEIILRLAAIERATDDPKERARLIAKLIGSADLKAPGSGVAFWDFALGRLNDIPSLVAVFEALGQAWCHADRTAAWTFLTHPDRTSADPYDKLGISQFSALKGMLLEWMRSDVPGALEQARSFEEPLAGPRLLVNVYLKWFATAPQDALAGFATEVFRDGSDGLDSRIAVMEVVHHQNPSLGLKLFESVPRDVWTRVDNPSVVALRLNWVTDQPQLATAIIERLPEPIASPLVTLLIRTWTQIDPAAAMDWLVDRSRIDQADPYAIGRLIEQVVRVDSTLAAAQVDRLSPKDQSQWAPVLAAEWANRDPKAAVAWAQARWQQGLGPEALLRGTEAWVRTDPGGAAAFIEEILRTVSKPAERLELTQLWVTADPSAALDSFRTLVPAEALDAQLNQALPASVAADPITAATAALKISNPVVRGQTVSKVGFQWGSRDPDAAVDWAASLPKGGEQSMAIRNIYQAWTHQRFENATASLDRLEPILRDQALIGIIHERMNTSVSDAADLSLRVFDSSTRTDLLDSVFRRWGRSNPTEASAWLQRSALPQPLQTQLRARIP